MASEEDNFDIDIYGDGGEDRQADPEQSAIGQGDPLPAESVPDAQPMQEANTPGESANIDSEMEAETGGQSNDIAQKIASTDASAVDAVQLPKHAPQEQGFKKIDGSTDNRTVDPGASTALLVSDLHWWVNDDDVRGWANQCRCEDELEDITFSEHKVNGKSKGQAYVLFKSPQAATAAKHKIESFGEGQKYTKKFIVGYSNPFTNPFKTLPKDGPARSSGPASSNRSSAGSYSGASSQPNGSYSNSSGGYRGGRGGGFGGRGGGANAGFNRGSFSQSMGNAFQGSGMSNFPANAMGNMSSYGGFQNRGGIGAMRGGASGMRGGRGGMMGMPMGGMNFGAMGMGMGMGMNMPQMGTNMAMQGHMGNQTHFNPAMFNQQQQINGDTSWNPHGAKRTRQE